jgi:site-specific DNA-methyltransferase (adenine-specific)
VLSYKGAHFATFPKKLIEPCVIAGCPTDGIALDVFSGAATTGMVALKNNRRYLGIELNPEYCGLAETRLLGSTRTTALKGAA